jgi:hypothetical protein
MLEKLILNNIKYATRSDELFLVCRRHGYDYFDIIAEIKRLVLCGELIELVYVLPGQHGDRVGILFPKGTEIFKQI